MTAATEELNGSRPAAGRAQRQAAARDAFRASVAAGTPLSGAALARQFDMSERWGRNIVAEVRPAAGANGNGQPRPTRPASRERITESREPTTGTRENGTADRDGTAQGRENGTAIRDVPVRGRRAAVAGGAALDRPAPAAVRDDSPPDDGNPAGVAATAAPAADEAAAGRSWQDSLITLTVAVVAAAASYGHMFEVAVLAGEPLWIARAFPVTVDGLVLAALRRGPQGRWWLRLGVAVSVAANVLSRYPDLAHAAGPIVSAWPPLALYGTHRLLAGARHRRTRP